MKEGMGQILGTRCISVGNFRGVKVLGERET